MRNWTWKCWRWALHWQILAALALALVMAYGVMRPLGLQESTFGTQFGAGCEFIGRLFMNALKMVIVPLVATSIISGVMHLGAEKGVGRLSVKTLLYYTLSGAVAVVVGLAVVNLLQPGHTDAETAAGLLGEASESDATAALMERVEGRGADEMVAIFERMFPPNIIEAASTNTQLLGIIVFSLLFGYFISRLKPAHRTAQASFWESTQEVMLRMTTLILRFAPIGVFGLVTPKFMEVAWENLFGTVLAFFFTVLLALAVHFGIVLFLALKYLGRIRAWRHYQAMAPVLLTAFSTASSSGTLPLTMKTMHERSGVSDKTSSFTLPLGATMNMDGTALYECVVVIFIAQLYASAGGVALDLGQQLLVVFLALTTSIGVAGVPAASLLAIAVILGVLGLPVEAIGVVWVTDRFLDMCRTAVNVFSDTVGAVIIGRSEGDCPYAEVPPEASS